MSGVRIHHQSDEPGVMVDFTWKKQRYVCISDDVSDCGESTLWRYASGRCRCSACRAMWSAYEIERRRIRNDRSDALVALEVCPLCGNRMTTKRSPDV